jgi:hypothetical protein
MIVVPKGESVISMRHALHSRDTIVRRKLHSHSQSLRVVFDKQLDKSDASVKNGRR